MTTGRKDSSGSGHKRGARAPTRHAKEEDGRSSGSYEEMRRVSLSSIRLVGVFLIL